LAKRLEGAAVSAEHTLAGGARSIQLIVFRDEIGKFYAGVSERLREAGAGG
jgi:hypothetical protein